MMPPLVECYSCGKTVTKRSTLALGKYRWCRTHPEVEAFLEAQNQNERWRKAESNLKAMVVVEGVRVMWTMHDIPVGLLLMRLRNCGYTTVEMMSIEKQVHALGKLSANELAESITMAMHLRREAKS